MKKTAIAPSNIAFIKYWGRKDEKLKLPQNGSISMNLSSLSTTTTVEFDENHKEDSVIINDQFDLPQQNKVIVHLDRIRKLAHINTKAKVVSHNNFPSGTGLSSSASGFAALTVAATAAAGLQLSEKELSIVARQGSGSACRSIPDGFVEWLEGDTSEASYAHSIFPVDHWDIADVVVIVSNQKKDIPTTEGQKLFDSSRFFSTRMQHIENKLITIKAYMQERKFEAFGELVEAEALELHAIMLTSNPSLIYLLPESLQIMRFAKQLRREGLPVYFTLNTGQDVHLLVKNADIPLLTEQLKGIGIIKEIIVNTPVEGAKLKEDHLF